MVMTLLAYDFFFSLWSVARIHPCLDPAYDDTILVP